MFIPILKKVIKLMKKKLVRRRKLKKTAVMEF